jgi:mannose-6-phosphate isomerase
MRKRDCSPLREEDLPQSLSGQSVSALLPIRMVEKPWGCDVLPAPFTAPPGQRIGEIWFEPPPELPQMLVKYIFTSEKLSVQVHPSDAQLPGHGKEECWLIIAAEPGAMLGIGFKQPIGAEAMRTAALDGSIEALLEWHPVSAGDCFHIPANTVHAIGAGVSLIEVQQTSDVTYRLYDYGRPRSLHLDEAIGVAKGEVYPAALRQRVPERGALVLADGPYFRLMRLDGEGLAANRRRIGCPPCLVIPLAKAASIAGEPVLPGQCGLALDPASIELTGPTLIAEPCIPPSEK